MAAPIFRTQTVPSDQTVLYQLSIRAPGASGDEIATYTFPLSPSALRTENNAMASYVDTQGPAKYQGVTRVVDRYGLTPPTFGIEGTTGWDQHSTDGYGLSGLQSIQALKAFLAYYETLNQQQVQSGISSLYVLEFYDYFMSQFWQIEPVGPQLIRQDAQRPLLTYYRFRWIATRPIGVYESAPRGTASVEDYAVGNPPGQAIADTSKSLGSVTNTYTPTGTQ